MRKAHADLSALQPADRPSTSKAMPKSFQKDSNKDLQNDNNKEWSHLHECLHDMHQAVSRLVILEGSENENQIEASKVQLTTSKCQNNKHDPFEDSKVCQAFDTVSSNAECKPLPTSPWKPEANHLDADASFQQECTRSASLREFTPSFGRNSIKRLDFSSFVPGFQLDPQPKHLNKASDSHSVGQTFLRSGSHSIMIKNFPTDFGPGVKRDTERFELCCETWFLRIYPGGFREDTKDYLGLFLCYAGENAPCVVSYKVTMINETGSVLRSDSFQNSTFSSRGQGRGWDMFVLRKNIAAVCSDSSFEMTVTIERSTNGQHHEASEHSSKLHQSFDPQTMSKKRIAWRPMTANMKNPAESPYFSWSSRFAGPFYEKRCLNPKKTAGVDQLMGQSQMNSRTAPVLLKKQQNAQKSLETTKAGETIIHDTSKVAGARLSPKLRRPHSAPPQRYR